MKNWLVIDLNIKALSSSKAEFYAISEAVKHITFVVQDRLFMGITIMLPVEVKVVNMGSIYMSENSDLSARTRHMLLNPCMSITFKRKLIKRLNP